MDFDGDGILDLISGSYDPGALHLFRGEGKGRFKARETLVDKSGKPIYHTEPVRDSVEAFGSWVAAADFDADGDLDLVIGSFEGNMFLRRNDGTRMKPSYAETCEQVSAAGAILEVPGGHASPVVVDWDGDGTFDLVSGCATGAVLWWKNEGSRKEPRFGPRQELFPPHQGSGYEEFLPEGTVPLPGIRSQVTVADWDGDGKLDVIFGDFCTLVVSKADLGERDRAKVARIVARRSEIGIKLTDLRRESSRALHEWIGKSIDPKDRYGDEAQARIRARGDEIDRELGLDKLAAEDLALKNDLTPFLAPALWRTSASETETAHGWVWLLRRR